MQNISEKIQALDADSVLSDCTQVAAGAAYYSSSGTSYSRISPVITKAPADDAGKYYIGIPNYTYGTTSYDALITLDGSDSVNDNPVVVGNHMDALLNMTQADANALQALQMQCDSTEASGYTLVSDDLKRSHITFNVHGPADASAPYTLDVLFEYTADVTYTDKDSNEHTLTFTDTEQSTASVGSAVSSADGSPIFSVFLFFDAYYSSNMTNEDIVINNTTGSDINFFIVNSSTNPIPGTYSTATIAYKNQNFTGSKPQNSLVFTNLPTGKVVYTAWQDAFVSEQLDVTGYLVETKPRNRKFNVDIKLFEGGSGFAGTVLADIDSTKLNY